MDIKPIDRATDTRKVALLFRRAADYVMLETGQPPNADTVDEFFNARPPNVAANNAMHVGLFQKARLVGIAGMTFGYPDAQDAYIGLLLLSPKVRGSGYGITVLSWLTTLAKSRGATRQLVAVLADNPKGRAFWEREGFVLEKTFAPTQDKHTRLRLIRPI